MPWSSSSNSNTVGKCSSARYLPRYVIRLSAAAKIASSSRFSSQSSYAPTMLERQSRMSRSARSIRRPISRLNHPIVCVMLSAFKPVRAARKIINLSNSVWISCRVCASNAVPCPRACPPDCDAVSSLSSAVHKFSMLFITRQVSVDQRSRTAYAALTID